MFKNHCWSDDRDAPLAAESTIPSIPQTPTPDEAVVRMRSICSRPSAGLISSPPDSTTVRTRVTWTRSGNQRGDRILGGLKSY
jgi:hypothetical protein